MDNSAKGGLTQFLGFFTVVPCAVTDLRMFEDGSF